LTDIMQVKTVVSSQIDELNDIGTQVFRLKQRAGDIGAVLLGWLEHSHNADVKYVLDSLMPGGVLETEFFDRTLAYMTQIVLSLEAYKDEL
jgi:hypothetical protein